jgi:uncharacterized membrane protein YfcA
VAVASAGAVVPSFIGIWTGAKLRRVISPDVFRKVVLSILGVIALKHIATAAGIGF